MTQSVSIWRWAVSEELAPLFARLIAADEAEFVVISREMSLGDVPGDPAEIFAQTEAKVRAMGLSEADLATTLAGLRAMQQEALAEAAAEAAEAEEDDLLTDQDGQQRVALASSHMFFDDPFASLPYEEIEGQVAAAMADYRAAISAGAGHDGQSMASYLGLDPARLYEDAAFDMLLEAGLAEVEWLWVMPDKVLFLSHWQEDKELPIDIEFGRAPKSVFEGLRAELRRSHEM